MKLLPKAMLNEVKAQATLKFGTIKKWQSLHLNLKAIG